MQIEDPESLLSPERLREWRRCVKNEVLPRLLLTVPGLVFPRRIVAQSVTHQASNVGTGAGHVTQKTDFDMETGIAWQREVGDVHMTAALLVSPAFKHLIAHELGHYHEMSVRLAHRTRMPSVASQIVWTEYFAERIAYGSGFQDISIPPEIRGRAELQVAIQAHKEMAVDAYAHF